MVIHQDSEIPMEVSVIRKPLFEQKKYIMVKNHVREVTASDVNKSNESCPDKNSVIDTKHETKKQTPKRKKKDYSSTSLVESNDNSHKPIEICAEDIHELKTVYYNCKAIIAKIEKKYSHLLNLEQEEPSGLEEDEHECQCSLNKKIVFDDDGQQLAVDQLLDNHICPKKLKLSRSEPQVERKNIEIEFNDSNINMPDNIKELHKILQNPEIEVTYRNKAIYKLRSLRQEFLNEIKFNKHSLIDKSKSNPDEVLDFRGANLSDIPGYLVDENSVK